MIRQQFTLYVENKPGRLAAVIAKLNKARIVVEGMSATSTADVGLVQLVTSDAAGTRGILAKNHVPYTVQDVAVLHICHHSDALARGLTRLGELGVNVSYVYATTCQQGAECNCKVVISAHDLDKVEEAWKGLD